MNKDRYLKKMMRYSKKIGLKKEVIKEMGSDLQEYFEDLEYSNEEVEVKLGDPTKFVDNYIEKDDLENPFIHKPINILFKILIYACTVIFGLLLLSPFIWLIAVIFQLHVEVGYIFQLIVSLVMFGIGFGGIFIFIKKDWL